MNLAELHGAWLSERRERWQRLLGLIRSRRQDLDLSQAREVLDGYGEVARDLSLARRQVPGTVLHRTAESLYRRLHDAIHRRPRNVLGSLLHLYATQLPAAVGRMRADIVVAVGLFLAAALAGYLMVLHHPDTGGWFLSEQMMRMVQQGRLWTDDLVNVMPSSVLAWEITTNNVSVAITAFALGMLFGLGTLYILSVNGLMLGAVLAYTQVFDMHLRLIRFIVPHGLVELSIIVLAAAAGLGLGRALARPGPGGRVEALRASAGDAGTLAAASVPFLIGSGLIEGYVSPDPSIGMAARVATGVGWLVVMLIVLDGRLWRRLAQTRPPARNAR